MYDILYKNLLDEYVCVFEFYSLCIGIQTNLDFSIERFYLNLNIFNHFDIPMS